jgi:hypothetical protein
MVLTLSFLFDRTMEVVREDYFLPLVFFSMQQLEYSTFTVNHE